MVYILRIHCLSFCCFICHNKFFQIFAVANAAVPLTADMNIKVPVNLKLQPRRHNGTLIFTSMHLMYLMIHFLCGKLEKILVSKRFFQIWHFFIFYRYCKYKQIGSRYTGSVFLELKVPVYKTVLKLQTNSLTVIRWQIRWNFSGLQVPDMNHKQIQWQHTGNAFSGLEYRYFWQNGSFTFC